MSGIRLVVGIITMGIAVPVMLFFLLELQRITQLLTIAAATFLTWCVTDFMATLLAKPRLKDRTPGGAFREDWRGRSNE